VSSDQPNGQMTDPTDNPPAEPSTEARQPAPQEREAGRRFGIGGLLLAALVMVAVIDLAAFAFFPPFPPGEPGAECAFPVCFIEGTLEFPAPHVVLDLAPGGEEGGGGLSIGAHPSITSSLLTMWIVGGVLLLLIVGLTRGGAGVPTRLQNVVEWAYESLHNFGVSIGGRAATPYIPIFVSFFLLILFSNWAGLIPVVGRIELLRAPTSDVNVTIGLALVSFAIFEFEGFRRLGARKYLSKFFPVYEFRNGIAAGAIAMFVGIVELLLDFVRPLTLSMRLFGNIYGGEVALGVITALTIAVLPVLLLGLEFMLNFIQALIFSILSLMYIVLAIEEHGHEEGEMAEEAVAAARGGRQPTAAGAH
jgi:F-type H+-transporting ATPase subunit a